VNFPCLSNRLALYNGCVSSSLTESRPFEPGTTGWTARDLDDPEIERSWSDGRYEIVEGVLTTMAPAYYVGGKTLLRLISRVVLHIGEKAGSFATELEIVLNEDRVVRADAAFLTPAEEQRQQEAALAAGRKDPARTRILVPPTLIIECVSPGHEKHDLRTKRRWYAEFGVPNYWLLDPFTQTLQCLVLRDGTFHDDTAGGGNEEVRPSLFPGLVLRLDEIWNS
jgi:Uma2 family endonuclease